MVVFINLVYMYVNVSSIPLQFAWEGRVSIMYIVVSSNSVKCTQLVEPHINGSKWVQMLSH